MPTALAQILGHDPDTRPVEPECTCRVSEAPGQNPACDTHPWWKRDPIVLQLADLTETGTPAWEAAAKTFGGTA
jgi:hypothetical protein